MIILVEKYQIHITQWVKVTKCTAGFCHRIVILVNIMLKLVIIVVTGLREFYVGLNVMPCGLVEVY